MHETHDVEFCTLLVRCPMGHEKMDCPFRDVRRKPYHESLAWFWGLSEAESEGIREDHEECKLLREGEADFARALA